MSRAKRDDASLFGNHCNDDGYSSKAAEQKFETLHSRDFHQEEETQGATGNCESEKGRKTNPHQQRNQIRKRETI